jgi:hypothetical protein
MILLAGFALSQRLGGWRSGLVLGLLLFIKLPFLLLWGLAALDRKKLPGIALGAALGVVLPAFVFGVSGDIAMHRAWIATLSQSTGAILCSPDNQGAFAIACLNDPSFGFVLALLAAGALAWLLVDGFVIPSVACARHMVEHAEVHRQWALEYRELKLLEKIRSAALRASSLASGTVIRKASANCAPASTRSRSTSGLTSRIIMAGEICARGRRNARRDPR